MGYTASAILCGVWLGVRVTLDGAVHRGAWVAGPGTAGEVRTDCGRSGPGHLTGREADCAACGRATEEATDV